MMFIVRSDTRPHAPSIKAERKTPPIVLNGGGKTDYFCVGDAEALSALREQGLEVIELRDGWYADDTGGGIGISGHGRYWEVRDTPFTVKEAVGPVGAVAQAQGDSGDPVNVRGAIFGV